MANVGKHMQGDMSMYTHDALKKRMGLRRHPGIAKAIERWWSAVPKSNRLIVSKELERVDRFGYLELNVNIQVRGGFSRRTRRTLSGRGPLRGFLSLLFSSLLLVARVEPPAPSAPLSRSSHS